MKQKLIDANELLAIEKLLNTDIIQQSKEASWIFSQMLYDIQASPEIDPESLPIVKDLKAELEKVKEERDAAIKELPKRCCTCYYGEKLCDWCIVDSPEEVWEWKGIQRHIRIDVKYGVAKGIGKTSCDAISDLLASVKKKMKEGYEPPNGDFSIVREGDLFVAFQSMRKRVKVYEDK